MYKGKPEGVQIAKNPFQRIKWQENFIYFYFYLKYPKYMMNSYKGSILYIHKLGVNLLQVHKHPRRFNMSIVLFIFIPAFSSACYARINTSRRQFVLKMDMLIDIRIFFSTKTLYSLFTIYNPCL